MTNRNVSFTTLLAAATFIIGWSLTPVFVRFMSDAYDPYTQAFIRYASAAVALLMYTSIMHRTDLVRAFRSWRVLAPMGILVTCMQLAWTVAIYNTTATKAQMVTTLQAPTVILLSFLVFHEERAVIRNPKYLMGSLLCIMGVIGVYMRDNEGTLRFHWDLAFILLLFVSIAWSVYAVWGRHTAKGLHPAAMFTVISCYVSLGFVGTMVGWGHPSCLITAGVAMNGIAFISGVVCIAAAHCAFHYAQVRLGSAYCSSIQLITPFITHIIALILWPDESLRWVQWLGGFMLIAGSFWVIQTQKTLES